MMGSTTWLVVLQTLCIISTQGLVHNLQANVAQGPSESLEVPDVLSDIIWQTENDPWVPLHGPPAWPPNSTVEDPSQRSPRFSNPTIPPETHERGPREDDSRGPRETPDRGPKQDFRVVMEPNGSYGQHAASQLAYLNMIKPKILQAAQEGAVIYDLGCSDGMNTLALLYGIRKKVRNFTVGFVDLPSNDWITTRKVIAPLFDEIDAGEAGQPVNGTKLSAIFSKNGAKGVLIPRSFYAQVAPNSSVHIAFSSTSVQYLSRNNPADRSQQAAEDWRNFLFNRAKELVPGGALHVVGLATYWPGSMPGHIWVVMQRVLNEAVHTGIINEEQKRNWQWPGYPRTEDEWKMPFLITGYTPADSELVLESFELVSLDTPYWTMARGNPFVFASLYVPSVMAWIGNYVAKTLEFRVRDLLEWRLHEEVRNFPQNFRQDFLQAVMTIRKRRLPHRTVECC